jgi:hypothetical protein
MYKGLLHTFMREMHSISSGELHCLPYVRSLLDFFEARGTPAIPLVVRCVVFGRREGGWRDLPMQELAPAAMNGELANGAMDFMWPEGDPNAQKVALRYRTLGFTHGRREIGSYTSEGGWNGHLVVVANGFMIDPTIGQLNDPDYWIDFDPPYEVVETDEGFLAGERPINGISGGQWVFYRPFPDERTYRQSKSWTDMTLREQLKDVGLSVAKSFEGTPDSELHQLPQQATAPELIPVMPPPPNQPMGEALREMEPSGKAGRNEACPCGSGKKYKKCCGG